MLNEVQSLLAQLDLVAAAEAVLTAVLMFVIAKWAAERIVEIFT